MAVVANAGPLIALARIEQLRLPVYNPGQQRRMLLCPAQPERAVRADTEEEQ